MATRVPQPRTPGAQTRVLSRCSRVRPKIEGNPEKPRPTIPQSHPSRRGNQENRTTSGRTGRPKPHKNLEHTPDKRPPHSPRLRKRGQERTPHSCPPL